MLAANITAKKPLIPFAMNLGLPLRFINTLLSPSGKAARLSILIYHRVLDIPDPLFPGEVDALRFDEQLTALRQTFQFLPLSEAIQRLRDHSLPARSACITFDDGYADNATIALPLLLKHQIPATFFIASGYLNGGCMFNDRVAHLVRQSGDSLDLQWLDLGILSLTTLASRRQAFATLINQIKYRPPEARRSILDRLESESAISPPTHLMMTAEQLLQLDGAGMELGGHTVNHPILASLNPDDARHEIEENRDYLTQLTGKRPQVFAYPNGKLGQDYHPLHANLVKEAGYQGAVATDAGVSTRHSDPYHLPRFTPWDQNIRRFTLRMTRNLYG